MLCAPGLAQANEALGPTRATEAPETTRKNETLELVRAVLKGDLPALEALLEKGVDPQARDKRGKSALAWAEKLGEDSLVELLSASK